MSVLDIFDSIRTAKGSLAKKAVLRTATPEQRALFRLALDPEQVFFYQVSTPFSSEPGVEDIDDHTRYTQFIVLTGRLANRWATGLLAQQEVKSFFKQCGPNQSKWYSKILNKDLVIGVEAKTYLSVFKGEFDLFELKLCDKWEGHDVTGWYYEPKFDGLRGVCVEKQDTRVILSRNGGLLFGNDHIIKEWLEAASAEGWVPDGELFGGRWNESVSNARTKDNKSSDNKFYVFDLLTRDEWIALRLGEEVATPLSVRKERLAKVFASYPFKYSELVPHGQISPSDAPKTAMADVMKRGKAMRIEGVIFKDPGSGYETGRKPTWLKLKPRETLDVRIVAAQEHKNGGKLGALIIEHNGVQTHIGTGYTEDEQIELWLKHLDGSLVGRTAEVDYQEITEDGKLLFNSFVRIRYDK